MNYEQFKDYHIINACGKYILLKTFWGDILILHEDIYNLICIKGDSAMEIGFVQQGIINSKDIIELLQVRRPKIIKVPIHSIDMHAIMVEEE